MIYLFIHEKVEGFDKWKKVFDDNSQIRQGLDSQGGELFRNSSNPNELVIITKWNDLESAKKFAGSDELKNTMQKAGVTGRPEMYFLEKVEEFTH